jgi:hypothetical protein
LIVNSKKLKILDLHCPFQLILEREGVALCEPFEPFERPRKESL